MHELNIRNGYQLKPGTDLMALARTLRSVMGEVRRHIEIIQVAEEAAALLDAADLAGEPRPATVVFDAVQAHALHVQQILSGEHDCPAPAASFSVTDDPETGELYMLVFAGFEEYVRAVDDLGVADYYPYWEDGSRLTGVSAAEWSERRVIWNRVLGGRQVSGPGSMFTLTTGSDPEPDISIITNTEAIFAALPDMDLRIHHALEQTVNSWSREDLSMPEMMVRLQTIPDVSRDIVTKLKPITREDLFGAQP